MAALIVAYAYSPRENTGTNGGYHFVTLEPINAGRFNRDKDDALCKPAGKFWGLDRRPDFGLDKVSCPRCIEIAKRLGLIETA